MQLAASIGSTGQGALRACHCMNADPASNNPEARNNGPLYADNHIMPGTLAVSPAITAPAPIDIRSAGKAQQSRVEVLANSDSVGPIKIRLSMVFTRQ